MTIVEDVLTDWKNRAPSEIQGEKIIQLIDEVRRLRHQTYQSIAKAVLEVFEEETGIDVWDPDMVKLHIRLQNEIHRILKE